MGLPKDLVWVMMSAFGNAEMGWPGHYTCPSNIKADGREEVASSDCCRLLCFKPSRKIATLGRRLSVMGCIIGHKVRVRDSAVTNRKSGLTSLVVGGVQRLM